MDKLNENRIIFTQYSNEEEEEEDEIEEENKPLEIITNEATSDQKSAMLAKAIMDKNELKSVIIAESRIKAKQFDAEKLKPFFIEYKEEPHEITDYDVCSNILLFIFVLLGLLLVFLCGLGIAVSNIL